MQEEQEAETIRRKLRRRSRAEFAKDAAAETRTSRLTPPLSLNEKPPPAGIPADGGKGARPKEGGGRRALRP